MTPPGLVVHVADGEGSGSTLVTLNGELDMATAPEVAELLLRTVAESDVVIEASGLRFMDSHGIAAVWRAHLDAADANGVGHKVVVRNPSPQVRRLLEITGLTVLIEE
jgi:anti-anti-sigma factor